MAAPTVNNPQSVQAATENTTVLTISAYTPTAGSDKKLVVAAANENLSGSAEDPTGITWDGNAMTQIGLGSVEVEAGVVAAITLWYYDSPASSAGDIVATWSSNLRGAIGAVTLLGVASGLPQVEVENSGQDPGPLTTNITTLTDDSLILQASCHGAPGSLTFGLGETSHINQVAVSSLATMRLGVSSKADAVAGAESMSSDQVDFNRAAAKVVAFAPPGGRVMSSLAGAGGLAGQGGIAGPGGGLAG